MFLPPERLTLSSPLPLALPALVPCEAVNIFNLTKLFTFDHKQGKEGVGWGRQQQLCGRGLKAVTM